MARFKNKIKNILGFVSIGVLFIITTLGIASRENKSNSSPSSSQDYRLENLYNSKIENEEQKLVCKQFLDEFLENDENSTYLEEYTKIKPVECQFVGCGGFF